MKKVIIIGATSGIGRELAKIFSSKGFKIGITGRRTAPQEAARQIYNAIRKKKEKAYITKRWIIIAWLLKLLPRYLYRHL